MARYLVDANLPRYARVWAGGDCEFVLDIDPALRDIDIWHYAGVHGLTIVSKDADFANLVFADESGPSVIQMRIGNMKFRDLDAFLARTWDEICGLSARHRLIQVFLDRIEAVS
jgi:predicted nuclease of predicted toxin-antitoxin system